jgi:hypothetical protein
MNRTDRFLEGGTTLQLLSERERGKGSHLRYLAVTPALPRSALRLSRVQAETDLFSCGF